MKKTMLGLLLLALCVAPAFAQNPPTNLSGTIDQNTGGVTLTWSAPVATDAVLQQNVFEPEVDTADDQKRTPRFRIDPRLWNQAMQQWNNTDDLEEFVEYRVYREGEFIGAATDETYFDLLPDYGSYDYEVTAYYTDGESTPAGPVTMIWFDPADWALLEDFDDGFPTDWAVETTVASGTWTVDDGTIPNSRGLFSTPYMLVDSDYPGSSVHLMERLLTPDVDITDAAGVVLSYEYYFQEYETEMMETAWSLDSGANWTVIFTVDGDTGGNLTASFDVTDDVFGADAVMFSWYYDDLGSWGWYAGVDNVGVLADTDPEGIIFNLIPQTSVVPAGGGDVVYDVYFTGQIAQPFPNGSYWTEILFPNGQLFGPVSRINFTIPAMFNFEVLDMTQYFPDLAPGGGYWFTAYVGSYTNPSFQMTDQFYVLKEGPTSDAEFDFNPEDWTATGADRFAELAADANGELVSLPTEFAIGSAYPNPFNPSTTVAVALPEASDLKVQVYNVTGQLVTELANGRYTAGEHKLTFDAHNLASGLYFVRATVPGKLNATQKVMLVR
ncbi:T9SS type A sorting domain-containing protein [bacterium]|nr:T9SS type A sorting domain-containing protein [bacterium]